MKAEKLHEIATLANYIEYKRIIEELRKQAENGRTTVTIPFIPDTIMALLKEKGYIVKPIFKYKYKFLFFKKKEKQYLIQF
ncbi:hypothetical protein [Myroides injenensis]|uniref:hypothetical protein n=1 Tax=Myroides injenensis TaxID=1183151 RepID=UPI000287B86B|nr:hypothetical protein [Myroides injenensis]